MRTVAALVLGCMPMARKSVVGASLGYRLKVALVVGLWDVESTAATAWRVCG